MHLTLEERLAKFMQTQETIIYSYDLATVPSILPAFANAKDLIVCDEVSDYGNCLNVCSKSCPSVPMLTSACKSEAQFFPASCIYGKAVCSCCKVLVC